MATEFQATHMTPDCCPVRFFLGGYSEAPDSHIRTSVKYLLSLKVDRCSLVHMTPCIVAAVKSLLAPHDRVNPQFHASGPLSSTDGYC